MATTSRPALIVARRPEDDRYTGLGSATEAGDDYFIVIDGQDIGGTYYCNAHWVLPGQRWASWGPAGLQDGFRTRQDAEQAQANAYHPADYPPPTPTLTPTPNTPVALPTAVPVWPSPELGAQVVDHMHTQCPSTPAGDWIVGQDPVDHVVHVVYRIGEMGFTQAGVRGMKLYQWMSSLRDAGFQVEARTDLSVFGRPHEHSEIAWWLRITGRGEPTRPRKPMMLALRPEPKTRTVSLRSRRPEDLRHPLTGEYPESVTFTYEDTGIETQANYRNRSQRVPKPGQWLLDLADADEPAN